MRWRAFFGGLAVLLGLGLGGCGDETEVFSETAAVQPSRSQNVGSAIFEFVLARAVPSSVDTLEFWGFAEQGQLVYGPVPRAKAPRLVLEQLPLTLRTFRIDYYDGDFLVGQGSVPVLLTPNGPVSVRDPDFVDVTAVDLEASPEVAQLPVGGVRSLQVVVTLSNGDSFPVTQDAVYLSSAPQVATVDSVGRVTAVGPGIATITASYRERSDTVALTVVQP